MTIRYLMMIINQKNNKKKKNNFIKTFFRYELLQK